MKDSTKTIRNALLLLTSAIVLGSGSLAGAQTVSTTYRGARQDPFTKYRPPVKRLVVKNVAMPVAPPPISTRIENYKAQKLAAMKLRQPVPKPTTALLLSEVQVTGIFRTPRGVAATVEATPIKLSYVIYPGEVFYNGMLVAIEETQLVFRRESRWTDGRRDVAVESKALRQANAYADSLSTQKSESDGAAKKDSAAPEIGGAESTDPKEASTAGSPNTKAVEALNSKVEKLLDLLKKQ